MPDTTQNIVHPVTPIHNHAGKTQPAGSCWTGKERRVARYVDFNIQIRMLIALIVLETGGIVAAITYLYLDFSAIIQAQMYRIHHQPETLFSILLTETGQVLVVLLGVNLLAIFVADRIWVHYVGRVLGAFRVLADKVSDLDFSQDRKPTVKHDVLNRMRTWRTKERMRILALHDNLQAIEKEADFVHDPTSKEAIYQHLLKMQQTLPAYSHQYLERKH